MRQLLQDVSSGEISVDDVPPPTADPVSLLVAARYSLISAGTERATVALGKQSLVGKARSRPDLVAKVVDNARAEGLAATYTKVRGRLAAPNTLGYSLSGMVLESCEGAPAAPGELVACAGAGRATHAEVVSVPRNLTARVPDGVAPEDAAYSTVACIALHGLRLSETGLGDVVAVIGLGLVGQLTMELAAAAGCVPLGMDLAADRVELARSAGFFATSDLAELEAEALRLTGRRGADGVLVTAASKSSAPLAAATQVARERAVVAIVGDVALESPREPLFSKELRLVVSRSYGPGRYDANYEERGVDYPAGYVRWTEGRNLEEVLRLMATGQLRPSRLTTHTFDLEDGAEAYALLDADEPSLGILLRYSKRADAGPPTVTLAPSRRQRLARELTRRRSPGGTPRIGVIGAGNFASSVLMPALRREAEITAVANATGASALGAAQRVGAGIATTNVDELIGADTVDAVVIATRHDTHADYVIRALNAGKHVFVEKPLAIDESELAAIEAAAGDSKGILMVGFNRRYAPLAVQMRSAVGRAGPLVMTYRVAAGRLPASHWTHDPVEGGGRIVGEVCHFVDFLAFMAGAPPTDVHARAVGGGSEPREDNVAATLQHADGSIGTVVYTALGDGALAKERVEVLGDLGAAVLDDFRSLEIHRGGATTTKSGARDKGHRAEMARFLRACREGVPDQPVDELAAVMRATFAIRERVASR
jgi:predicted dehydrogenase/threonine dehydrogenase-like Zn-dependent dehydrogenase